MIEQGQPNKKYCMYRGMWVDVEDEMHKDGSIE
jgi:hypothetical protein